MRKKKLLKFDIIHPPEFLEEKQKEWKDLDELSLDEYRARLIKLRSNYSDYYTYHLQETGNWETEEFFLLDPVYIEKVAQSLLGVGRYAVKAKTGLKEKIRKRKNQYTQEIVDRYIQKFCPDVIFVRSQPLPSQFWRKYRFTALLVSRLSARLPKEWHPNDWDLIYTDQPDFQTFFELHGVPTIMNDQGFDKRIVEELRPVKKQYPCTFVGGLGTQNFLKRTEFINSIADKTDFMWWGYWWKYGHDGRKFKDFPVLKQCYQGTTSGMEMYQIYADSKICLNDYVDTANGIGFNQRIFEVLGTGGFLLTRYASNFKKVFPDDIFVTYQNERECLDRINYFMKADKEREEIAAAAKKFIAENYDYSRITLEFGEDLEKYWAAKFQKS